VKLVFVTNSKNIPYDNLSSDYEVKYLESASLKELNKNVFKLYSSVDQKPVALVFFSLRIDNFWDFIRAKFKGVKVIYVSTMKLDLYRSGICGRIRSGILRYALRSLYSSSSFIVSSTEVLQSEFRKIGITKEKLICIGNGVNLKQFYPVDSSEKLVYQQKLQLCSQSITLLYVGLFIDRKGVDKLLQIVSEINSGQIKVQLVMVGHEMSELIENSERFNLIWPELRDKAVDEGWLTIRPFTSEIDEYYKAADIFCFMSKLEGMPNVLLEAMASGNVLLTSEFEGFSEAYGSDGSEYILIKDVDDGVRQLKMLIENTDILNGFKVRSASWASSNFDRDKSIEKYLTLFNT
jgi:glycosyltransferase involved in cell wall biosynthesis